MKIIPVGLALSSFLAFTLVLGGALHFGLHAGTEMDMSMNRGPGMTWTAMHGVGHHGPAGFLVGVAVAYTLGWYAALVYVPLYNFFNRKRAA